MTDVKCVENLARRGMGVVSCLGSSEPADCQSYNAENCTDVTVSVHKEHMQVVNSRKAQEEVYIDQESVPATMNESGLRKSPAKIYRRQARCWSGLMVSGVVSYKQLFAGTGRLKNHAIDTPRVSRWETSDSRWEQESDIDEKSRTCRVSVSEAARHVKDTFNQVIPVTAEVPDAADSLNKEFEREKEGGAVSSSRHRRSQSLEDLQKKRF